MTTQSRRTWLLALTLGAIVAAVLVGRRDRERDRGQSADPTVASEAAPIVGSPSLLQPSPVAKRSVPVEPLGPSPAGVPQKPPVDASTGLVVHGRALSEAGVGLAGASVELRAWSGVRPAVTWSTFESVTESGGGFRFSIDPQLASLGFGVAVSAEGLVEAWRSINGGEYDATRGVEITVEAARAISGRVIDAGSRPISGTRVQLWYGSDSTWPTIVDADGRFTTPARAPRRAFELIVEAPRYPRRTVPVAASTSDRTDVGDVVFRRGGSVAGVVVNAHGDPVEELGLFVNQVPEGKDSAPRVRTDSRGRFEFTDLGEGTVAIFVDGIGNQGGPPGSRRTYRGGNGGIEVGRRDVRIVAETECTLVLRFVDAETGNPVNVGSAEYGARYEGTPAPERLGQGVGGSDAVLSTRLTVKSGHRYDVTVRSPGFDDGHAAGIDVRDLVEMTVEVRMRRSR